MTSISGVDFSEAWNSRLIVEIHEMSVPVLGLRQLLINKSASGRDKDEADLPAIRRLLG